MIRMARNVIVENDWCSMQCKAIAPDCVSYKSKLPIRDEFFRHFWSRDSAEPYTIMTQCRGVSDQGAAYFNQGDVADCAAVSAGETLRSGGTVAVWQDRYAASSSERLYKVYDIADRAPGAEKAY